jgi:hypothetical protein
MCTLRSLTLRTGFLITLLTGALLNAAGPAPTLKGDWSLVAEDSGQLLIELHGEKGSGSLVFDMRAAPLDLEAFSHINVQMTNGSGGATAMRKAASSSTRGRRKP